MVSVLSLEMCQEQILSPHPHRNGVLPNPFLPNQLTRPGFSLSARDLTWSYARRPLRLLGSRYLHQPMFTRVEFHGQLRDTYCHLVPRC